MPSQLHRWSLVNILAKNHYFFPTPHILEPLLLPCFFFFFFRKICNCHRQRHHFHLGFCWILSIGWGRCFFVKKLDKGELNINPFVPNALFLYPLKISENCKVFWCFQGVEIGCIGNKWVKHFWCGMGWRVFIYG